MNDKVIVELSKDQALVLFEWLARTDDRNSLVFDHEAEQIVLWLLEGKLEKALSVQFSPLYEEHLVNARERIVAEKVD